MQIIDLSDISEIENFLANIAWLTWNPRYLYNMKQKFTFEVTDTFGGDANYCWVHKHEIEAKSLHGALCILSRIEGLNFRSVGCDRYDARGACICAFLIEEYWN